MERATNIVGKNGRAARIDSHEVGVSAAGKFGRDAPAPVVFVEVEVNALRVAEITEKRGARRSVYPR